MKKYLLLMLPCLLILALVGSIVSFFEYNRYLSKQTLLKSTLKYDADLLTQQVQSYKKNIDQMFTRLQNRSTITRSLTGVNIERAKILLQNEIKVKPYLHSLTLFNNAGAVQLDLDADLDTKVDVTTAVSTTNRQADLKQIYDQFHQKTIDTANGHTSSNRDPIFLSSDLANDPNLSKLTFFVGENIYQKDQYLGTIIVEINATYIAEQLSKQLPNSLKVTFIFKYYNHYFSPEPNKACHQNCFHPLKSTDLETDKNGDYYFQNSYAELKPLYFSNNDTTDNLLLQYKNDQLLHRHSLAYILTHSTMLQISLSITLFLCALAVYLLIQRERKITTQFYAERLSQAFTVLSSYIERIHEYDLSTVNHVHRVAFYSTLLATEYGLKKESVKQIQLFSSLHDIGKIAIPDAILKKEGSLTDDEWNLMISHVNVGYDIIHEFKVSPIAENIVRFHHEKWNGSGYTRIAGTAIPVEARVVSIADCYDTLTTERPYKKAFSHEKACAIINAEKGNAFEPLMVEAFNRCAAQFKAYHKHTLNQTVKGSI